MTTITWISKAPSPIPKPSDFKFTLSQEAAKHNSQILEKHDYDLEKATKAYPNSIISPGSELRPLSHLELLIGHHPNFKRLEQNLTHGVDYPIDNLDEDTRQEELEKQIIRGNHKSALTSKQAKETVNKLVQQDIELGYAIPITKECVKKLKHGELYPLGLQHQWTIDEDGNQKPKKRVTHDLSNRKKHGLSINQRVREEDLPETTYGHALLRFLHLIHHIRSQHPNKRILMCKSDIDKAYRRLHTHPKISAKCMAAWTSETKDTTGTIKEEYIGTILTRLPFGSSPAPSEFSICSETVFDLANDLLHCPFWNPDETPSPYISKLPLPERLPDNIPFGTALQADVHLPKSQKGGTEGYIDDGAIAVLDSPETYNMVKRAREALPMANHLIFRPLAGKLEPCTRPDAQSIRKLAAEGQLRELLIFLGWEINSRSLMIALPKEKVQAWTQSIEEALNKITIDWDTAKTLVGRLNHVGYIIPSARHFLNRIRKLEYISDRYGSAMITPETTKDLNLWISFLHYAGKGISINSIVYRTPTTICISDACEFGMGGYNYNTGLSWRYEFTKIEREVFTLNTKEFLGSQINAQLNLPLDKSPNPCLLSIGDSNCAAGWLHKSNFDPETEPIHNEIAREHAKGIIEAKACDYSQHIPGISNIVADSLSRDFHLPNNKLISMIYSANPPFLPPQMKIIPLPPTITSWIGSLARKLPKRKESPHKPTISTLAAGVVGWTSNNDAKSTIPIWKDTKNKTKSKSSEHSCMQFDVEHLIQEKHVFREQPLERPLATWHRPLFQVVGQTHRKIPMEKQI